MRVQAAGLSTRRAASAGTPFTACRTPPRPRIFSRRLAAHVTAHDAVEGTEPAPAPSSSLSAATRYAMSGLALAMVSTLVAEPALAAGMADVHTSMPMEQFQLAENQEFFSNVARYGRYFVTVMLGTGYVMLRPITNAFTKSPLSAILTVAAIGGSFVLIKFTLEAMLGVNSEPLPFEYVQGQF